MGTYSQDCAKSARLVSAAVVRALGPASMVLAGVILAAPLAAQNVADAVCPITVNDAQGIAHVIPCVPEADGRDVGLDMIELQNILGQRQEDQEIDRNLALGQQQTLSTLVDNIGN